MPSPSMFWDKVAEKYAASPIKDMASYEATMDRTSAHLNGDDKVLEVGCGTGTTALKLAPSVAHITSSDVSAKMIEIAKAKARDQNIENVTFVQATPMDVALDANAPYDAVLAYNFLHLVEDLPATMRRIHDLLKPGGMFISKSVCLKGQGFYYPILIAVMRFFGKAPFVAMLTGSELEVAIRDAGFEIVEAAGIPTGRPNHFVVARKR